MYWLADISPFLGRRALRALATTALAFELGCGASGDQVLGNIRPEQGPIHADAASPAADASGACSYSGYPGREIEQTLAVNFTVDRSASVLGPTGDKWDGLFSGFTQFLHNDVGRPSGASMGIGYFPLGGASEPCLHCRASDCGCLMACGCSCDPRVNLRTCQRASICDGTSYQRPDVEIAPQNGAAIATSLAAQVPYGPTVIRPALRGALDHATAYQASHPDERVVEVLIVGGPPLASECQPDAISDCADVAGSSSTTTNIVMFDYVGPSLDLIAARGGGKVYQFDSHRDDIAMRFQKLVEELRDEPQCVYALPDAVDDYGRVNVEITTSADAGAVSSTLVSYQVKSRDACNGGPGWYYDRPDHPTRIVACDDACRRIHGPSEASVTIKVGCPTDPPPP